MSSYQSQNKRVRSARGGGGGFCPPAKDAPRQRARYARFLRVSETRRVKRETRYASLCTKSAFHRNAAKQPCTTRQSVFVSVTRKKPGLLRAAASARLRFPNLRSALRRGRHANFHHTFLRIEDVSGFFENFISMVF